MMDDYCCILCKEKRASLYHEDGVRCYWQCPECHLVYVPPRQHLSPAEEKKRYDLHENDPDDKGYRKFLSRLFHPLNSRLPVNSFGLDFGCGPGPTLHLMFEEAGHRMNIYDPFYENDPSVFEHTYDFITATEVVEHLSAPLQELERLWQCLHPNGYLGIMTKLVLDKEAFAHWHYIRDDTHVAFFSKSTFLWLANRWKTTVEFVDDDVMIFQK